MNRIKLHINLLIKNSLYGLFVLIALPLWSQSSLDWSYDYSLAETNMTIGISEMVIDEITVEGNTFPVGSVLGVFYQNNIGEFICAGSVIWDYQANMLPVWSSDELLQGQALTMFAFVVARKRVFVKLSSLFCLGSSNGGCPRLDALKWSNRRSWGSHPRHPSSSHL